MGDTPSYRIEPLDPKRHDRFSFRSGVLALDRYLTTQASQDARRHVAAPYVLVRGSSADVLGYYTLSSTAVLAAELPGDFVRKLPRYPSFPATLLGRLAVDERHRGDGFGRVLLADALQRCLRNEIASALVVVDAKDDLAVAFYLRRDFIRFSDQPNRLFLPMSEIAALFG